MYNSSFWNFGLNLWIFGTYGQNSHPNGPTWEQIPKDTLLAKVITYIEYIQIKSDTHNECYTASRDYQIGSKTAANPKQQKVGKSGQPQQLVLWSRVRVTLGE